MTRIVSGFAGSLALAVPRSGTRPTSDRVREAIFSALEARDALTDAVVFDLYAGSGALGLEAVSRGAVSVVLVERSTPAAALCRRNADAVRRAAPKGHEPRIRVATQSVQAFLDTEGMAADLVFIDPPYDLPEPELARALHSLAGRLTEGAVVLVERSTRSPEPRWPAGIALDRHRKYGETTLWWATAHAEPDSAGPDGPQPAAPSQSA
ncbi:16S rRNA (guanine(966)-N(2))-methyltransferase RsmD [Rathayibacter sp. YIM 133350]|uniref:16S rRNA (guanine(966)-N(2))-methyltransferase RsmD n=1 Tax=Rathayibacter sp. YIM 133350 TaxID=3131992 RepID=UPI00307D2E2E